MRRRPSAPVDIELVLYAALAAVDVFSGVLVAVLALVSLYWLALAKLQVRAPHTCGAPTSHSATEQTHTYTHSLAHGSKPLAG